MFYFLDVFVLGSLDCGWLDSWLFAFVDIVICWLLDLLFGLLGSWIVVMGLYCLCVVVCFAGYSIVFYCWICRVLDLWSVVFVLWLELCIVGVGDLFVLFVYLFVCSFL